jgi:hypothetical protein
MGSRSLKGPLNVEWVNVTYRSVWATGLVLVLAAGGGSYWFFTHYRIPRHEASTAIAVASDRLTEATELSGDESTAEVVDNATIQLALARTEFDRHDYREAKIAAMRSERLSLRVIQSGQDAGNSLVKFSKIEGDVRIKRAGGFSWKSANTKMTLQIGDQVKTASSGSAEVIYFDGTVTRVAPGSLLEIRDLFEDPVTKVRRVREKLTWGEVHASTEKRNVRGSYHEVTTDKVSARSEDAGEFRVAFDKEEKTSVVDVFGGRVALQTASRKDTIQAGERIKASAEGKLSTKEALPGVPRLLLPSDQRVFVFENPSEQNVTLTWEASDLAEQYRLMIADKPLFTKPLYDDERKDVRAVLGALAPGSYHWKVASISRAGVQGPFSSTRAFRVSSQRIRDRTDNEPPKLEITEFVHIGQLVIVNGVTDPDAKLWIDNNKVDVFEDGSFNAVVKLRREGLNELLLANKTRKAYVEGF